MDVLRGMPRADLSIGSDGTTCPPGGEVDAVPGADPRAPIHRAWVAGRLAIAFDETGDDAGAAPVSAARAPAHGLEAIEALDVSERPYIWDL